MYKLYDYVDAGGRNDFKAWSRTLDKRVRGKLNAKLDMLRRHGPDLPPELLSDTSERHIQKLRIKGNVALRPMLCRGPIGDQEYTLLLGAREKDRKPIPAKAASIAEGRRQQVMAKPSDWRCEHERVR